MKAHMNLPRRLPTRRFRCRQQTSVLEVLANWVGQGSQFSNAERIQLMRRAYFADVDELEKSGTVIIPR